MAASPDAAGSVRPEPLRRRLRPAWHGHCTRWATSLISTHWKPTAPNPELGQVRASPGIAQCPLLVKSSQVRTAATESGEKGTGRRRSPAPCLGKGPSVLCPGEPRFSIKVKPQCYFQICPRWGLRCSFFEMLGSVSDLVSAGLMHLLGESVSHLSFFNKFTFV